MVWRRSGLAKEELVGGESFSDNWVGAMGREWGVEKKQEGERGRRPSGSG